MSKSYLHFQPSEFKKCVPSCSIDSMDVEFMEMLEDARTIAGIPFKLNSAYRSRSYELSKGRSGNSFHTAGRAVDIHCVNSEYRYRIVDALMIAGFNGIGISKSFIHVDNRKDKMIWLYED